MVHADHIRETILRLADERGKERPFLLAEAAREVDRENWRMLLDQVKLVAVTLVQEGKLAVAPKTETADTPDSGAALQYVKKA